MLGDNSRWPINLNRLNYDYFRLYLKMIFLIFSKKYAKSHQPTKTQPEFESWSGWSNNDFILVVLFAKLITTK